MHEDNNRVIKSRCCGSRGCTDYNSHYHKRHLRCGERQCKAMDSSRSRIYNERYSFPDPSSKTSTSRTTRYRLQKKRSVQARSIDLSLNPLETDLNQDGNITVHEYEGTMINKEPVPSSPGDCGRDDTSVADDITILTEAEILGEYYFASLYPAQGENEGDVHARVMCIIEGILKGLNES